MKKLVDKINAWWASKTQKQRSIITIVSTTVGIVVAFFGIIGIANLVNA